MSVVVMVEKVRDLLDRPEKVVFLDKEFNVAAAAVTEAAYRQAVLSQRFQKSPIPSLKCLSVCGIHVGDEPHGSGADVPRKTKFSDLTWRTIQGEGEHIPRFGILIAPEERRFLPE
jgi:hypothetical protein